LLRPLLLAWAVTTGCASEHALELGSPRGGQGGGEVARIGGDDFTGHGPVSVYFGVRAAKAVVIESPWLITVLTPEQDDPGTVDVLIRFGDGEERRLPGAYTYVEQSGIVLRPEIGG